MLNDPLTLPFGSFLSVIVQLTDEDIKDLLAKEMSGQNRSRHIQALQRQLRGGAGKVEETEGQEIRIEGGKAFVMQDGQLVPYTSTNAPESVPDTPERKKWAMEVL